ncbi:hypothetical protein LCGC14_1341380 [marine sediment metagenome]|uniref:DUF5681 domain-containing protein n=1 Tax=marine sediment metagenome TaxID=412755 RepID=A0A0F9NFZ2_9ZZZZ
MAEHPLKDAFPVIEDLHNADGLQAKKNPIANIGDKAYSWPPGTSGNPAGRPPNSVTTLLKNKDSEDNQVIADKLYSLAISGDMRAIQEYIDRTDGKVVDKHLNVNLTANMNPEMLSQFQALLTGDKEEETKLLEEYPKR